MGALSVFDIPTGEIRQAFPAIFTRSGGEIFPGKPQARKISRFYRAVAVEKLLAQTRRARAVAARNPASAGLVKTAGGEGRLRVLSW
jgi:hypothetical protein